jgi:hypothetical protein
MLPLVERRTRRVSTIFTENKTLSAPGSWTPSGAFQGLSNAFGPWALLENIDSAGHQEHEHHQ